MEPTTERKIDDVLSRANKKNLKFLHVLFAGGLAGSLASIPVLLMGDGSIFAAAHPIVESVFSFSLYGLLVTGFLFSMYTGRGFIRSTWIIWKWGFSFLLLFVLLLFISPDASGLSAYAKGELWNDPVLVGLRTRLLYVTLALIPSVIFIYYISFKKPWKTRPTDPIAENPKWRKLLVALATGFVLLAVFQVLTLESIRRDLPEPADLSSLPDGEYSGEFPCAGAIYGAALSKGEDGIQIQLSSNHGSVYYSYASMVIPRIEREMRLPVDGITGATTTSSCIQKAVEAAIRKGKSP